MARAHGVERNTKSTGAFAAGLGLALLCAVSPLAGSAGAQEGASDSAAAAQLPRSNGEVMGGGQWWWQDEPDFRYREYRDLPNGLFLDSFLWRDWSGAYQFSLVGEKALRGDQKTVLGVQRGSRLGLDLSYQEIPHLLNEVAITPYGQPSRGTFTLPDSSRARVQAGQLTTYAALSDLLVNSARDPELQARTELLGGRLRARPSRGWSFAATVERRKRDGFRARTGSLGFSNVIEVGAPETDHTLEMRLDGDYLSPGGKLRGQAAVGHTSFENQVDAMVWDNYARITDSPTGPARGRSAVFPDNNVLYGRLGLSYEIARATLLSANLGLKRGTQNDPWLPFTINSAIPQSHPDSLPGTSTNAKFVQDTEDVRLTTRAISRLTGTVRFHHMKYDNRTETFSFIGRSPFDASWQPGPFENHTPGFDRIITGLDAAYDVSRKLDVSGILEWRKRDFDEREVDKTEEVVAGGGVRVRPSETLSLDGSYRHGNRVAGEFDFDTDRFATPFDIAARRQDVYAAGATWSIRQDVELVLAYDKRDSRYPESTWGLQQEREEIGSAAVVVHPRSDLDVTAGLGLGRIKVFMRDNHLPNPVAGVPQPLNPDSTWLLDINDRNSWAFARADWWPVTRKVRLSGEYEYRRGRGTYDFTTPLGNAVDPPEVDYWSHEVEAQTMVRVRYDLDLGIRYNYDRAVTQDWQQGDIPILDLNPTNPTQVRGLLLGAGLLPLYNAHRIAFIATKRF
ncbi:MAG: MtrB/PioB family outer membrane beta-barrel protein [Candidatus Eiseniibacteriota bacterium]